jgi:electron transfer flavoprotein alpha subunit
MENGILVITETAANRFRKSTYEVVSEGRRLADQLNTSLSAVVVGSGVLDTAAELTQYGADRVLVCDAVELANFDSDRFTQILFDLATSRPPKIILFGASIQDKQLATRLAARLDGANPGGGKPHRHPIHVRQQAHRPGGDRGLAADRCVAAEPVRGGGS